MKPTKEQLQQIIQRHYEWLNNSMKGIREDLSGANLAGVDLNRANLAMANLTGANLTDANLAMANLTGAIMLDANLYGSAMWCARLSGANLAYTNLCIANLTDANLVSANLTNTNLVSANLTRADMTGAILTNANLAGANLMQADMTGAILTNANLAGAVNVPPLTAAMLSICPHGEITVYKKCAEGVVVLLIPRDALRSNATGRKCRASKAVVIALPDGHAEAHSLHDSSFAYRAGETVVPHEWATDRWTECGGGIHFYLTREEAEAHS